MRTHLLIIFFKHDLIWRSWGAWVRSHAEWSRFLDKLSIGGRHLFVQFLVKLVYWSGIEFLLSFSLDLSQLNAHIYGFPPFLLWLSVNLTLLWLGIVIILQKIPFHFSIVGAELLVRNLRSYSRWCCTKHSASIMIIKVLLRPLKTTLFV
jgi:hypothetical protein